MGAEPLRLELADSLVLGYVDDFWALLEAIDAAMPKDAVLCLEGTDVAPDVARFVSARGPADAARRLIEPNTIWPKPGYHHLALSGTNLAELRELGRGREDYELADHFVVYGGDQALLWAHDAGDCHLRVWKHLDGGTVERLRAALGGSLRPE